MLRKLILATWLVLTAFLLGAGTGCSGSNDKNYAPQVREKAPTNEPKPQTPSGAPGGGNQQQVKPE